MSELQVDISVPVARKLLRGYQYSRSDGDMPETGSEYDWLNRHFDTLQMYFGVLGFSLARYDDVILLEGENKALSNDEKQTIVALYLLADLWLESGRGYADLYSLRIAWRELEWFRDGYGREYLAQVGISREDGLDALHALWGRLARRGIVDQDAVTGNITLRRPAERLLNMARTLHNQLTAQNREVVDGAD